MKVLKPLSSVRNQLDINARECGSAIGYFKKQNLDFDVFLPTIGKNLQRELVWSLEQKRAIIESVILGKHIPHVSIINTVKRDENGKGTNEEIWEIIDGKQRLTSIFGFMDDEFTIILEGEEFLFSELPEDYRRGIDKAHFRYYEVLEDFNTPISDETKINWFKFINFAGTPQETEHMNSLKK